MVTIRTNLPVGLLIVLIFLASKVGYDYYRVFAWRQTTATVISAHQTCEYAKKSGRRSLDRKYPLCDDADEIARLKGEGYRDWDERGLRIEAAYLSEAGEKITVTIEPRLEDVGLVRPGSKIAVRVSSGSAALAIPPDPGWALCLLAIAVLLGAYGYVQRAKRARAGANQASSIS